jgi:hypothetical protein
VTRADASWTSASSIELARSKASRIDTFSNCVLEQIADQRLEHLDGLGRAPEPVLALRVELVAVGRSEQVDEARDAAQRRLEIVRGDVREALQVEVAARERIVGTPQLGRARREIAQDAEPRVQADVRLQQHRQHTG